MLSSETLSPIGIAGMERAEVTFVYRGTFIDEAGVGLGWDKWRSTVLCMAFSVRFGALFVGVLSGQAQLFWNP